MNWEKIINELSTLSYNWDGKGALPIEDKVISNISELMIILPVELRAKWRIFPDTNGTIMLVHRKPDISTISIGNDDFSYFARNKSGKSIAGESDFSVERTNSIIKEIEDLFGSAT